MIGREKLLEIIESGDKERITKAVDEIYDVPTEERDFDEMWEIIEREFNWERVRIVMSVLNWRWGSLEPTRIPHIEDLKKKAKDKLQDLYNHKDYKTVSGGGFEAYRFDGEQHKSELGLRFCIEEIGTEFRINKKI